MNAKLWRSLDELHGRAPADPVVAQSDGMDRRDFFRIAAASAAVLATASCGRQPAEEIVPYVNAPAEAIEGESLEYTTASTLRGYARGVIAVSRDGRPIKLEGNPAHPASVGATSAFDQAETLTLYDPDRAQAIRRGAAISTWDDFRAALAAALERERRTGGAGLRILTGYVTSPSLLAQLDSVLHTFPNAKWHTHEPIARDAVYDGSQYAFGRPLEPRYAFEHADVIVSLDSDFLADEPGAVAYARAFALRRNPRAMNRFYAAEPMPTVTGSNADERLRARASRIPAIARALVVDDPTLTTAEAAWVARVRLDLAAHRGRTLVIAGEAQPLRVHALAMLLNLGSAAVTYGAPVAGMGRSLAELATEMHENRVATLLIIGTNPVYDSAPPLRFAQAMQRVAFTASSSLYDDETAALAQWHIPAAHFLEQWSDARAFDGSVSIVQPLIAPLYGGRSPHELVGAIVGDDRSPHDLLRARYGDVWRAALTSGIVSGATAAIAVAPVTTVEAVARELESVVRAGLDLALRPDPTIFDGRFANNGWLQELPKPITRITWGNAAMLSPATAGRLAVRNEQLLDINGIEVPAWIVAGHADDAITLHLGHGRTRAGRFANGVGANAYRLRTTDQTSLLTANVKLLGRSVRVATTQHHATMAGRDLVRYASLAEAVRDPGFATRADQTPARDETLYGNYEYRGHAWAMAIDLNTCVGCSACVVACNAENNIPIVGRQQVLAGREMQWLRVDRYFDGDEHDPRLLHEPVPCMHCETAPCEVVCPVGATVHSGEGLNEMVYNRCVGTRYCSNNCPYKVRRFNFLQYSDQEHASMALLYNPEVTVRTRGVMEKCSYCVQRIEKTRIAAEREGRPIRDGEFTTACAQACPARAITFGDGNDAASAVANSKRDPRNYALLAELNTRPRTTYLAKVINPADDPANGRKGGTE